MGLFSLFRKNKQTTDDSHTYMIEDDYCQIELLPERNYTAEKNEAEKIEDFGREHFTGVGFTAVYERKRAIISTASIEISINDLEAIFQAHNFSRIKHINYIGGGPISYNRGVTRAYGNTTFSFWTEVCDDKVTNIWLTSFVGKSNLERKASSAAILNLLAIKYGLILVDWNACIVVDLRKIGETQAYINEYH